VGVDEMCDLRGRERMVRLSWIALESGSGMEIEGLGIGDKNEELGYVRTGRWKSGPERKWKWKGNRRGLRERRREGKS
jgi:hypothetical protein